MSVPPHQGLQHQSTQPPMQQPNMNQQMQWQQNQRVKQPQYPAQPYQGVPAMQQQHQHGNINPQQQQMHHGEVQQQSQQQIQQSLHNNQQLIVQQNQPMKQAGKQLDPKMGNPIGGIGGGDGIVSGGGGGGIIGIGGIVQPIKGANTSIPTIGTAADPSLQVQQQHVQQPQPQTQQQQFSQVPQNVQQISKGQTSQHPSNMKCKVKENKEAVKRMSSSNGSQTDQIEKAKEQVNRIIQQQHNEFTKQLSSNCQLQLEDQKRLLAYPADPLIQTIMSMANEHKKRAMQLEDQQAKSKELLSFLESYTKINPSNFVDDNLPQSALTADKDSSFDAILNKAIDEINKEIEQPPQPNQQQQQDFQEEQLSGDNPYYQQDYMEYGN